MDTENELRALRYLINNLILYVYDLRMKLEALAPSKKGYKIPEPNVDGNDIAFDLFSIKREKYDAFIAQYGIDIVTRACVKLDEFVKMNEYVPYGRASDALSKKFIKEVLFEELQKKPMEIKKREVNNENGTNS